MTLYLKKQLQNRKPKEIIPIYLYYLISTAIPSNKTYIEAQIISYNK
jgi:hypothetical protein